MSNRLRDIMESIQGHLDKHEAKVGVFYFYQGEIYGDVVNVRDGEISNNITHHGDCKTYYHNEFVYQLKLPRNLRFDHYPRGRVMFLPDINKYTIVMDKKLDKPQYLAKITNMFKLRPGSYIKEFEPSHYSSKVDP